MGDQSAAYCLQCSAKMVEAVQLMVHEGRREKPSYFSLMHCAACKISKEFFQLPRHANLKKFGIRLPGIGVIRAAPPGA